MEPNLICCGFKSTLSFHALDGSPQIPIGVAEESFNLYAGLDINRKIAFNRWMCFVSSCSLNTRGVIHKKKIFLEKFIEKFLEMKSYSETCPNSSISWKISWAYWENGAFLVLRFESWFTRTKNDFLKNFLNSRIFSRNLEVGTCLRIKLSFKKFLKKFFKKYFFLVNQGPERH